MQPQRRGSEPRAPSPRVASPLLIGRNCALRQTQMTTGGEHQPSRRPAQQGLYVDSSVTGVVVGYSPNSDWFKPLRATTKEGERATRSIPTRGKPASDWTKLRASPNADDLSGDRRQHCPLSHTQTAGRPHRGVRAKLRRALHHRCPPATQSLTGAKHEQVGSHQALVVRFGNTVMILPQVHLRKPCYDFYFL